MGRSMLIIEDEEVLAVKPRIHLQGHGWDTHRQWRPRRSAENRTCILTLY
jgi:hypothetical protein